MTWKTKANKNILIKLNNKDCEIDSQVYRKYTAIK